jgi:elongation factor P
MGSTNDLRSGAILKFNGENCAVVEYQHIKPGKGGAYYQVKMRNIKTGKVAENRFRSGESIEFVRVERRTYQYLYDDGQFLNFMDQDTYEQIPVERNKIGDDFKFLKENGEVQIAFEGEEVLAVELPAHVNLRITHSEPGVRGDTATNVTKPATLESGAEINVPIFINEGDLVRVDTRTGDYIERVKE